jgi:hypothetical protein
MPYQFGQRWPLERCRFCGQEGFRGYIVHARNCIAGMRRLFDPQHLRGDREDCECPACGYAAWNEHDLETHVYMEHY